MAKNINNIFVRGLSGALGDQFIIRKTRSGQTIIANKPSLDPNREFSIAQKAQQEAFRQATSYAKFAKSQPLYIERAKVTGSTAYNIAVSDWFGQPEIVDVDLSSWSGGVGQPIRVRAQDNVKVVSVRVAIRDLNNNILEQGEAVQSTSDAMLWTYTTTTNVPMTPGPRLDVTAQDLPGNIGAYGTQLN